MSTYLVFGATSGIGAAIVDDLLEHGHHVIAVGRNPLALDELQKRSVQTYACDLCQVDERSLLWNELSYQRASIQHVVYAAGIAIRGSIDELRSEDLQTMFAVNTLTVLELMQWCASLERGSTLTLFSSNLAQHPLPNTIAYSASKAAVEAACTASASAFGARGIRINTIAPGPIDTPMLRQQFSSMDSVQQGLDDLARLGPLQRIGNVQDVVETLRYVVQASWLTGQVITIDGGFSCPS